MSMEPVKIAIADDHDIVANGYAEIINTFPGYKVEIIANNGKELYDKILAAKSELR